MVDSTAWAGHDQAVAGAEEYRERRDVAGWSADEEDGRVTQTA